MRLGFEASSNGQNDTPHVRFVSVIFYVWLRLENASEDARLPQILILEQLQYCKTSVSCLHAMAYIQIQSHIRQPILALSHTFVKLFLRPFSSLQLIQEGFSVVSYKRKYVHEVQVNRLVILDQEKSVVR